MAGYTSLGSLVPPTRKLFQQDAYSVTCQAEIIALLGEYVVLNQTVFYGESGGQDCDLGSIDGVRVVDVQHRQGRLHSVNSPSMGGSTVAIDTVLIHRVEDIASFHIGQSVKAEIDWDRRYKHMRNHSTSHVVFHVCGEVVSEALGQPLYVEGCHITEDGFRFDFGNEISGELKEIIEKRANELLLAETEVRMVPDNSVNDVFYWSALDIVIPCGGTHVRSFSELGQIKLKRSKRSRTVTRIEFKSARDC
ncbi:MAG: alanine--tRNA ligase-related protein [Lysobacterales bacterium]